MSAFNAADYLAEAISSILCQTFADFEFIIIDDGSTDNTPNILADYAKKDARIIIITQPDNKGLIAALNIGFLAAQGKYIARMDADDISFPERLDKQYMYMECHSNVVVLGTLAAFINEEGQVYGIESFLLDDQEIRTEIALRNRQFRHGAVMIRRTVVSEKKEIYDRNAVHYEDFEYWPRILKHGKAANLSEVLYLYRKRGTSLTATKKPEMREGTERVILREQISLKLLPFRFKDVWSTSIKAKCYKPASVVVNGMRLRTDLKWQYQSYLFALSKLYIKRKDYVSAALVMSVCFAINPPRYVYAVFEITARSFQTSHSIW